MDSVSPPRLCSIAQISHSAYCTPTQPIFLSLPHSKSAMQPIYLSHSLTFTDFLSLTHSAWFFIISFSMLDGSICGWSLGLF